MSTPEIETLLTPTDADQLLYDSEGYRVLHVNPQGSAIGQGVLITRHDDDALAFVGGPSGAEDCYLIVRAIRALDEAANPSWLVEPVESWLGTFVNKYRPATGKVN